MIEWTGNLKDNCKATWNGLHIHAEKIQQDIDDGLRLVLGL